MELTYETVGVGDTNLKFRGQAVRKGSLELLGMRLSYFSQVKFLALSSPLKALHLTEQSSSKLCRIILSSELNMDLNHL